MSIKLNTFIDIISTTPTKDAEGFITHGDNIVASVRAYFEPKNSTEKWSNMAQFSEATALFRFRKLPSVTVTTSMVITCDTGRYEILSVEDVKQRGMYLEILARKIEGSS
jgi:head-tail adaptor